MKQCSDCQGTMKELVDKTPEGFAYQYYQCTKCGEEIVNMQQLHNVAQKYRFLKKYSAKLSRWGLSLGVRIPKEMVEQYHLKQNKEVILIPEKEGIKLIPA